MKPNPKNALGRGRQLGRHILLLGLYLTATARGVQAHEGPPFPIIVDKQVGPYVVSVWTDPDIGTGTFFVVLEPVLDGSLPKIVSVQIGVEPVSRRLEEEVYAAEPQTVNYGARYYTEVTFDQGEMWKVRVIIEGQDWRGELHSEVKATPDGTIGPIGLLLYALPFVGIGILWFRAMMRRRQQLVL